MDQLTRATDATLDVLEALCTADDALYGLAVAKAAGRKTGVVYPILSRLESAGWVESHWESEERSDRGPRRRFYRLTAAGAPAARALLVERRGGVVRRPTSGTTPARRPRLIPGRAGA
ncbi:hypothetical protein SUDANB95_03552 [Actinosynnema sp. ALI-1.44]